MSTSGSIEAKRVYSTACPLNNAAISCARSHVRFVTRMRCTPERCRCFCGKFTHFARTDDHHRVALERAENLAGQFHRRVAYRNGHLPDARLRANALGHSESACEHVFQQSADRSFRLRYCIGILQSCPRT